MEGGIEGDRQGYNVERESVCDIIQVKFKYLYYMQLHRYSIECVLNRTVVILPFPNCLYLIEFGSMKIHPPL